MSVTTKLYIVYRKPAMPTSYFVSRIQSRRLAWLCVGLLAFFALSVAGTSPAWAAAQCSAVSPVQRLALLELYTSEGCNSCPPAENWLSKVGVSTPGVVPLALHVNYWDSLGWRDRFAQAGFTDRQQALSERGGSHIVYTPEVALAGSEVRDWQSARGFAAGLAKINAQASGADIRIDLGGSGTQTALNASFTQRSAVSNQAAQAFVAVYENHLVSRIGAGENGGATLHHEFVVRQWIGPVALVKGVAHIQQTLNLTPDGGLPEPGKMGVAAFVQAADGEVLQALALPACD